MTDGAPQLDHKPRPLDHADIPVDDDGYYEDGYGDRSYIENIELLALHHVAVANGWEQDANRSPYRNLRALLNSTAEYKLERTTVEAFAFAFIAGYGPSSTRHGLNKLADEGVPVPGGTDE